MNQLQRKIILALKRHRDHFTRTDVDIVLNRFLLGGYSPEDVTFPMAELEVLNSPIRASAPPSFFPQTAEYAYAKVTNKF